MRSILKLYAPSIVLYINSSCRHLVVGASNILKRPTTIHLQGPVVSWKATSSCLAPTDAARPTKCISSCSTSRDLRWLMKTSEATVWHIRVDKFEDPKMGFIMVCHWLCMLYVISYLQNMAMAAGPRNPVSGKWEEKHLSSPPAVPSEKKTHLYSPPDADRLLMDVWSGSFFCGGWWKWRGWCWC